MWLASVCCAAEQGLACKVQGLHHKTASFMQPFSLSGSRIPTWSFAAELVLRVWAKAQADIHTPATTIKEALYFSARCRLMDVDKGQLEEFVEEVIS